jgi:hypothetical protein
LGAPGTDSQPRQTQNEKAQVATEASYAPAIWGSRGFVGEYMSPIRAIYVGIAAALTLAIWFVMKARDPGRPEENENDPKPAPTRRHELFEARNRIRRQIELLDTSPHVYGRPSDEARSELQGLLQDIESELKEAGPV